MKELFYKLLGIDPFDSASMYHWQVSFANMKTNFQRLIFLLLGVALGIGVWWVYKREPDYCSMRKRRIMAACRIAGVLTLLLIVSNPVLAVYMHGYVRGKVVVLQFMDDHCTDICPIVAQGFVDAYRDLGPLAGKVVFAAVNVNPHYRSVPAVAAFSAEHQLNSIPGWHFLTGSLAALRAAWHGYNISVGAPNPNGDIIHTSAIYFIDPEGRERYLALPQDEGRQSLASPTAPTTRPDTCRPAGWPTGARASHCSPAAWPDEAPGHA